MKIKLLERLEDDLKINRVWIADEDGQPVLLADVGGIICDLETKAAILAAGMVSVNPRDAAMAFNWPIQCRVLYQNSDGTTEEKILEATSANPLLLEAVQKFHASTSQP